MVSNWDASKALFIVGEELTACERSQPRCVCVRGG